METNTRETANGFDTWEKITQNIRIYSIQMPDDANINDLQISIFRLIRANTNSTTTGSITNGICEILELHNLCRWQFNFKSIIQTGKKCIFCFVFSWYFTQFLFTFWWHEYRESHFPNTGKKLLSFTKSFFSRWRKKAPNETPSKFDYMLVLRRTSAETIKRQKTSFTVLKSICKFQLN